MISSILFSKERKPSVQASMAAPDEILQNSIMIVGGTVFVHGGLQIDAKLRNSIVKSLDGKPIVVTALGKLQDCVIEGTDVLVCGDFSGEIVAKGDVEVTDTATFSGNIKTGGYALISPVATEHNADVRIMPLPKDQPVAEVVDNVGGLDLVQAVTGETSQSGHVEHQEA